MAVWWQASAFRNSLLCYGQTFITINNNIKYAHICAFPAKDNNFDKLSYRRYIYIYIYIYIYMHICISCKTIPHIRTKHDDLDKLFHPREMHRLTNSSLFSQWRIVSHGGICPFSTDNVRLLPLRPMWHKLVCIGNTEKMSDSKVIGTEMYCFIKWRFAL